MATSRFLLALPPAVLAALSTYTGYYSYISITDVQTYEEPTKKAAEYSNIAEDQLHQTRTTEGAGAVAVRGLPLLCSSTTRAFPISNSLL